MGLAVSLPGKQLHIALASREAIAVTVAKNL
jgi:hypothetical protein